MDRPPNRRPQGRRFCCFGHPYPQRGRCALPTGRQLRLFKASLNRRIYCPTGTPLAWGPDKQVWRTGTTDASSPASMDRAMMRRTTSFRCARRTASCPAAASSPPSASRPRAARLNAAAAARASQSAACSASSVAWSTGASFLPSGAASPLPASSSTTAPRCPAPPPGPFPTVRPTSRSSASTASSSPIAA